MGSVIGTPFVVGDTVTKGVRTEPVDKERTLPDICCTSYKIRISVR